jgi:hypothetical protein
VAQAYTLFLNRGAVHPLRALDRIVTTTRVLRPAQSKM